MIKCSAGTAKALGMKQIKVDALPTTAYLMVGERCSNDCSFCPQARSSGARADLLSRVTWPGFDSEMIIQGIAQAFSGGQIKRTCLQVVESKDALTRTKQVLQSLHRSSEVPVCVSSSAGGIETVAELIKLGADRVSLALDAACARVFARHKGRSWDQKVKLIREAALAFPGRISTHLIVGLGETEEEMLYTVQQMIDLGVTVAMFAFTPVKGTYLEHANPPALSQYRRIQAAHRLMMKGLCRFEQMSFAEGRLTGFGVEQDKWVHELADGEAFRTSGCPDCNRPYYNEKPGGLMYNYPRPLSPDECQQVLQEMEMGVNI